MIPNLSIMVAAIGCLVALYVLTRCIEISEGTESSGARLFSAMTAFAAVVAIIVLVLLALENYNAGLDVNERFLGL